MDIEAFRNTYMNEMNCVDYLECNPNFAFAEYREIVANKMIDSLVKAAGNEKDRHDYLKYNEAMRKAARKFGYKTTRELKAALMGG